jgi:DNA-binding CsgD family transcriptional regulator
MVECLGDPMGMGVDVLKLIDLVYTAAADLEAWPAAISAIAEALDARAMSLTIADPEGRSAPFVVAPRTDPKWLRAYADRWAVSNIVRDRGCALPFGEIYDFENLGMPRPQFERTPFYREFWAPQRVHFGLFTLLAREETAVSAIGFYRSLKDGRFDADKEQLLRALGPHLRRAVGLNLRLARSEVQRNGMAEMLNRSEHGALLVDLQAGILFANSAALVTLSDGNGLRTSGGRLAARTAAKTAALHAMIAGDTNGAKDGMLTLSNPDGARMTLEIVRLGAEAGRLPRRPAAMVFVKESNANALPSGEQIQQLFELTPAQAVLAHELLHGDGIPAAAERLGISRSTARTHLLELFQKTGTNRQAELVRVILQRWPAVAATRANLQENQNARGRRKSWRVVSGWMLQAGGIAAGLVDALRVI